MNKKLLSLLMAAAIVLALIPAAAIAAPKVPEPAPAAGAIFVADF